MLFGQIELEDISKGNTWPKRPLGKLVIYKLITPYVMDSDSGDRISRIEKAGKLDYCWKAREKIW